MNMLDYALKYIGKGISIFPINPNTKKPVIGSWKKYQTEYATPEEIKNWFSNDRNGIAIVTGKISNLFVVDFDKYKPGYSEETALRLIPENVIAPTVRTIRNGQHIYFRNPEGNNISIRAALAPGIDYRGEGGYVVAPPSKNMLGKQYSWETSLDDCEPPALPDSFIKALRESTNNIYTHGDDNSSRQVSSMSSSVVNSLFGQGTRDQDIFHVANLLVKAGCEKEYLHKVIEMLALSCNPPFSLNEAKDKIKSALQRGGRRESNLSEEVRDWVLSSSGVFLSSDVVSCLHLSSRDDTKNVSKILERLKNEGLIEKHGNKRGQFRTLDQDEEVIDFMSANTTPYGLRLPLGIHEWVHIHKGNIIVVAGESNAGKSALCLNVARMNMNEHDVKYLSSEMQDGAELRIRLEKFGDPLESWRRVKFTFRTDNFPDKICPDDLNIIDYLDEGTDAEAYKMPMRIRQIADKLKNGIAVIALQKDPNKGLGFGGSGTLNRSRLYLTLTRGGIITIEKAKIWRNENVNPNGLFCDFKLAAGCKFSKIGDWRK